MNAIQFQFAFLAALLLVAYLLGAWSERRHLARLDKREQRLDWRGCKCLSVSRMPSGTQVIQAQLVTGNVVVSLDYFRRLAAALRALFGGPLHGYQRLLTRGRREALLRLREAALSTGYDTVINVRLYTAPLATSTRSSGTAGVEILAQGTAVKVRREV